MLTFYLIILYCLRAALYVEDNAWPQKLWRLLIYRNQLALVLMRGIGSKEPARSLFVLVVGRRMATGMFWISGWRAMTFVVSVAMLLTKVNSWSITDVQIRIVLGLLPGTIRKTRPLKRGHIISSLTRVRELYEQCQASLPALLK